MLGIATLSSAIGVEEPALRLLISVLLGKFLLFCAIIGGSHIRFPSTALLSR